VEPPLALSTGLAEAGALLLAALVAVALLASLARTRALGTLGVLVVAPLLLIGQVAETPQWGPVRAHPVSAAVAALAGLGLLVLVAAFLRRRPNVFPLLVVAVLPFRVPVESGGATSYLLVPLYLVVAAGALAFLVPHLRGEAAEEERDPKPIALGLAGWVVLYALQVLYSGDTTNAVNNLVFFYAPFALVFTLMAEVEWTPRVAANCVATLAAVAVVLVGIGFVEYATRTLLLNPKVIDTNAFSDYFRVNSLFFDPNIYGRYLVFVMLAITSLLLWAREQRVQIACAAGLAVLWGGLVLTFSQSSFAALLCGLAVLAALRWNARKTGLAVLAGVVVAVAVVALVPSALNTDLGSQASVDRATAGRVDLIQGGLDMFGERPAGGWGSGSFAKQYRTEYRGSRQRAVSASHTTPITVAAEQGVPGLIAYVGLVVLGFTLLVPFAGRSPLRAFLLAAFAALILHTLIYASFLEDPVTWTLLGIAAALPKPPRLPRT
jgi:hypothetical protein